MMISHFVNALRMSTSQEGSQRSDGYRMGNLWDYF